MIVKGHNQTEEENQDGHQAHEVHEDQQDKTLQQDLYEDKISKKT